jgi:hypothetical protein
MQAENIIDIRTSIICIDSTNVKAHPEAFSVRKLSGEQSVGRFILKNMP